MQQLYLLLESNIWKNIQIFKYLDITFFRYIMSNLGNSLGVQLRAKVNEIFIDKLEVDKDIINKRAPRAKKKEIWQERSSGNNSL